MKTVKEALDDDFRCETFGPLECGTRNNNGKSQLSMILEAKHAINGCAAVLEMGAKKYSRGNWRKGLNHNEVVDSLLRHLTEYMSGEESDAESGLLHVDHILCNALFLAELTRTHPEKRGK